MATRSGTEFAQLLMQSFEAMVNEVRTSLQAAGHSGLTVANEMAMQAIDDGASSASSLGRATGVSRQAAAKTISTLETLGYVTRELNPGDGREKSLRVTPQGHGAISIGAAAFDQVFERWQRQTGESAQQAIAALEQLAATDLSGPSD